MVKKTWLILLATIALLGCNNKDGQNKPANNNSLTFTYPDLIPIDTANKMIGSYLNSINYTQNDTDIHFLSFKARLLRDYLDTVLAQNDTSSVKMIFAHTLAYINSGHGNQYAGYKNGALTLVIVGYKPNGDIVYFPTNLVLDAAMPCPTNCPPGAAGAPLLPSNTN